MFCGGVCCVCRQPKDGYESDDIVIPAANKVSLKCPCTSTTFVDPVQNKVRHTQ